MRLRGSSRRSEPGLTADRCLCNYLALDSRKGTHRMPAVTVDDITVLPRIPEPDPVAARQRPVRTVTSAPRGLRGRGLPRPARVHGRRPRRSRPVRPHGPDGRGGVRARRAEGHAVAPAPRLRDRHLHDGRHVRARRLERRRRRHHQRRHPVDDRRRRDPPHREAAGGARRRAAACSTASSSGSTCRAPRSGPRRATRTSGRARSRCSRRPTAVRSSGSSPARSPGTPGPGSTYTPMTLRPRDAEPGRPARPARGAPTTTRSSTSWPGTARVGRRAAADRDGPAGGLRRRRRAHGRRRTGPGEPQPEPRRPGPRRPADPRAGRLDGPVRDEHARGGRPGVRGLPGRPAGHAIPAVHNTPTTIVESRPAATAELDSSKLAPGSSSPAPRCPATRAKGRARRRPVVWRSIGR